MSQPVITLSDGVTILSLDPDLMWSDEFAWAQIEQAVERSVTGALIIHSATKVGGREITLMPPDEASAWMTRAVVEQLLIWEAAPEAALTLTLRGIAFPVVFRRHDGPPISASPVVFVADPQPGEIGDWYLVTLRFLTL